MTPDDTNESSTTPITPPEQTPTQPAAVPQDTEADGYYAEDAGETDELDLSFLDDEKKADTDDPKILP